MSTTTDEASSHDARETPAPMMLQSSGEQQPISVMILEAIKGQYCNRDIIVVRRYFTICWDYNCTTHGCKVCWINSCIANRCRGCEAINKPLLLGLQLYCIWVDGLRPNSCITNGCKGYEGYK